MSGALDPSPAIPAIRQNPPESAGIRRKRQGFRLARPTDKRQERVRVPVSSRSLVPA